MCKDIDEFAYYVQDIYAQHGPDINGLYFLISCIFRIAIYNYNN